MALDEQIDGQLAQTIGFAALSSVSSAGDPTFASASNISVRIEPSRQIVSGPDGTKLVTSHRLIINAADATPTYDSRFWLPGDSTSDATKARKPARIQAGISETGSTDFYEISL